MPHLESRAHLSHGSSARAHLSNAARYALVACLTSLNPMALGCGGDSATSGHRPSDPAKTTGGGDDSEVELLDEVNAARARGATCGLKAFAPAPPLTMNAALRAAAHRHSQDMADHDLLTHTGSDGSSPWDRAREANYDGFPNAENIARGQRTASAAVSSWLSSSGHCANMMSSGSNEVGVGHASNAGDETSYWTLLFGVR